MACVVETICKAAVASPALRDEPTSAATRDHACDLGGDLGGACDLGGDLAPPRAVARTPDRHEKAAEMLTPTRSPLEARTNTLDDEGEELDCALFYRKRFLAYSARGPQPLCQEKLQELCVEMENTEPCMIESSPIGQALIDRKRFHSRRRMASPRASPRKCGSAHGRGSILRTERELNL